MNKNVFGLLGILFFAAFLSVGCSKKSGNNGAAANSCVYNQATGQYINPANGQWCNGNNGAYGSQICPANGINPYTNMACVPGQLIQGNNGYYGYPYGQQQYGYGGCQGMYNGQRTRSGFMCMNGMIYYVGNSYY